MLVLASAFAGGLAAYHPWLMLLLTRSLGRSVLPLVQAREPQRKALARCGAASSLLTAAVLALVAGLAVGWLLVARSSALGSVDLQVVVALAVRLVSADLPLSASADSVLSALVVWLPLVVLVLLIQYLQSAVEHSSLVSTRKQHLHLVVGR